jgi:lycopene cyclase domain-containing protein
MIVVFIPWDIWFTDLGVWGFNPYYLSGIYFFNLPLEECLFFILIPYCCIFTYHVVWTLSKNKSFKPMRKTTYTFSLVLFICGMFCIGKVYTFYTFIGLSIVFLVAPYVVNMRVFFKTFIILIIPFLIVNGILTGSLIDDQIVWYNNENNLGIRLFTIPLEDIFYNCFMLLLVMMGYQSSLNKKSDLDSEISL